MTMQIYVGTYAKYNNGSLKGEWVNLEEHDKDSFYEYILELHKDEADPEFMFQDWEEIPDQYIGESYLDNEFWDYLEFLDTTHFDREVVDAGLSLDIPLENIEDAYYGEYRDATELAEEYVDSNGMLLDVPENLQRYFDFEAFGRDLAMDFIEEDGHWFFANW